MREISRREQWRGESREMREMRELNIAVQLKHVIVCVSVVREIVRERDQLFLP